MLNNHFLHSQKQLLHQTLILRCLFALVLLPLVISCGKKSLPPAATNLMIVNAIPGNGQSAYVTDFTFTDNPVSFKYSNRITYQSVTSRNNFAGYIGDLRVKLFQLPDTMPKDKPVFDLNLHLPGGSMHTLLLAGTVDAPDTLFRREYFTQIPNEDSSAMIRFVNLRYGSDPLSVNLINQAEGGIESSLSYKQLSGFKSYRIPSNITSMVFEIRNAATGVVKSTFTMPLNVLVKGADLRYRYHTVIICGEEGGTGLKVPAVFNLTHFVQQ